VKAWRFNEAARVQKAYSNARTFAEVIDIEFNRADPRGKLKWKWLETELKRELGELLERG